MKPKPTHAQIKKLEKVINKFTDQYGPEQLLLMTTYGFAKYILENYSEMRRDNDKIK